MSRTIAVFGATGAQGGSVARFLLDDPEKRFRVRAITRSVSSEKAQALQDAGAEVVCADLDDKESLVVALTGVDGVFGVTNFWEVFAREADQGRNLFDAAAQVGVKQFVWSGLENVREATQGALVVPHFDIKGELEDYGRSKNFESYTIVRLPFYFDNFFAFFPPRLGEDGTYSFGFPLGSTRMAGIAVRDLGGITLPIFINPDAFNGKIIGLAGDELSGDDYASIMSEVTGANVKYNHIPEDVFAAFGFPGAEELANMFKYYRETPPDRNLAYSRELYPNVQSFRDFATNNAAKFKSVLGL